MENADCSEGFCGLGHWEGVAEVYNGQGQFLGNGADQRHVRSQTGEGLTRIDLAFVGPLKFSGHYFIAHKNGRRLYQGPANCGSADALGTDAVTAHGYWPDTGLSQKFMLILAPDGQKQYSFALMSRGEQLLYAIVGENAKVLGGQRQQPITMINGGTYDLQTDPKAGRAELLLHKSASWVGELSSLSQDNPQVTRQSTQQGIRTSNGRLDFQWAGSAFLPSEVTCSLQTNHWQAWTNFGSMVGSYSLYGGRALSGMFHYLPLDLRVWRREVISSDGLYKAILNLWYQGETKVGTEWGVLQFCDRSW